jgi:hypothetical protein
VAVDARLVLYTFLLSCSALLLMAAPHKHLRWVLITGVFILGIVLALGGFDFAGLAVMAAAP